MNVQQELIIAHQEQQHVQIMLEVLLVLVKLVILEMVSLALVNHHFLFFFCAHWILFVPMTKIQNRYK